MSQETPTWTDENFKKHKIVFQFRTWDEFFGKDYNPRPHYDQNILKSSVVEIDQQCQVETINLHTHLYNRDDDTESLTDYAFALLWFAGYIISPRYTARRKLDYTMFGQRNQVKPLLTLYSRGRLILFVAQARSVEEGLPIIMAGIMRMNVSEFPRTVPRTMFPAILLINRYVLFIKVKIDLRTSMKVGLGLTTEQETVIEGYSTMSPSENVNKTYGPQHLPALFDALEAFKKFVRD